MNPTIIAHWESMVKKRGKPFRAMLADEEGFDVVQTIDTTSGEPVCVTYHTDFSGVPRTA